MKRFIVCAVFISLSFGCNGKMLTGGTDKTSVSGTQDNKKPNPKSGDDLPSETKDDPSTSPNEPFSTEIIPNPIITPSVIAGAFLTCKPIAGGADCETRSVEAGPLVDIPEVKFYIIRPEDLKWTPTSFKRQAVGLYQIQTTLPHYAVGISNPENGVAATWVIPPATNLLGNSSFEQEDDSNMLQDRYVVASPWNVAGQILENCAAKGGARGSADSQDGLKYVELTSICIPNFPNASDSVSQAYTSKPNHLYELRYFYKANPLLAAAVSQEFTFTWEPGIELTMRFNRDTAAQWREGRSLKLGSVAQDYIHFKNNAKTVSRGPFLDNVRIYDLGLPPESP